MPAAPKLITAETAKAMKPGAVTVDVSIDQGGFRTAMGDLHRGDVPPTTTKSDPAYVVDDVVHYCVTNMPGAAERTLSNVKAPFVLTTADKVYARALMADPCLRDGRNIHDGHVTYKAVAEAFGMAYVPTNEGSKGQKGIAIKTPRKRAM